VRAQRGTAGRGEGRDREPIIILPTGVLPNKDSTDTSRTSDAISLRKRGPFNRGRSSTAQEREEENLRGGGAERKRGETRRIAGAENRGSGLSKRLLAGTGLRKAARRIWPPLPLPRATGPPAQAPAWRPKIKSQARTHLFAPKTSPGPRASAFAGWLTSADEVHRPFAGGPTAFSSPPLVWPSVRRAQSASSPGPT
jgi:hypothetical protein